MKNRGRRGAAFYCGTLDAHPSNVGLKNPSVSKKFYRKFLCCLDKLTALLALDKWTVVLLTEPIQFWLASS